MTAEIKNPLLYDETRLHLYFKPKVHYGLVNRNTSPKMGQTLQAHLLLCTRTRNKGLHVAIFSFPSSLERFVSGDHPFENGDWKRRRIMCERRRGTKSSFITPASKNGGLKGRTFPDALIILKEHASKKQYSKNVHRGRKLYPVGIQRQFLESWPLPLLSFPEAPCTLSKLMDWLQDWFGDGFINNVDLCWLESEWLIKTWWEFSTSGVSYWPL